MDFWSLIKERKSIRKFTTDDVTQDDENRIFEAIRLIPTAGNLQAYGVISIRNQKIKEKLVDAALGQTFIKEAPLVMCFYADTLQSATVYQKRGEELYSIQDATIAAAYTQLAATALKLGSVWIGAFDTKQVSEILNLDATKIPISIMPIGYPAHEPRNRSRRALEELIIRME